MALGMCNNATIIHRSANAIMASGKLGNGKKLDRQSVAFFGWVLVELFNAMSLLHHVDMNMKVSY